MVLIRIIALLSLLAACAPAPPPACRGPVGQMNASLRLPPPGPGKAP